ncbi:hypothetical protein D3C73_1661340 [compost metagenome]
MAKPKNTAAPKAPMGFHLPKIMAAMAIKPWPDTVLWAKLLVVVSVMVAPPSAAKAPLMNTPM